jgi:hypothetical protein
MSDVSLQIQRGRWWFLNDGIPPGEKTLAGGDQGFDEKCHSISETFLGLPPEGGGFRKRFT